MRYEEIPHGKIDAASRKLWAAFGESADTICTALTMRPSFVERVADFARAELNLMPDFDLAREIMGKDFFGPREAVKHFGVSYSTAEKVALSVIPFTAEMLRECKGSHILVAIFPLSIIDIGNMRNLCRSDLQMVGCSDWYRHETWGQYKGKVGWQLIRKGPVPKSSNKNYAEQTQLLQPVEVVPDVQALVYTMVGHFLETGAWLFDGIEVRCCTAGVAVGANSHLHYMQAILFTDDCYKRGEMIGLASAIKPLV